MDNNKPNNYWPTKAEEFVYKFEQAIAKGGAITNGQKNLYYNIQENLYYRTKPTIPAPPSLGAGGVENLNHPNKQLKLKLK